MATCYELIQIFFPKNILLGAGGGNIYPQADIILVPEKKKQEIKFVI